MVSTCVVEDSDLTYSGWNCAAQMYLPLSLELLMPSTLES